MRRCRALSFYLLVAAACVVWANVKAAPPASRSVVTTVAGAGWPAGTALTLPVGDARGIAYDSSGNLLIASPSLNRVLKLTATGDLLLLAGTGGVGAGGDGGAATLATMFQPEDVASDADGNVYFSDMFNGRIRRVTAAGVINTVATGFAQPRGIALDDAGYLYVADGGDHKVWKIDLANGNKVPVAGNGSAAFTGDGGPALDAALSSPHDVAIRNGDLFIADYLNNRVRKVDVGGIITTVAGGGTTIEDGIPAVDFYLGVVRSVTLANDGTLFVSGAGNRVARVDTSGRIWTLVSASNCSVFGGDGGPATQANVCAPWGMAVDGAGGLVFSDSGYRRIRRIDDAGVIHSVAGNLTLSSGGDGGPALEATMSPAGGLAVDGNGNLFVADTHNKALRVVSSGGTIDTAFTTNDFVTAVAVDLIGTRYILTTLRLFRQSPAGHTTELVLRGGMKAIATDPGGNVFVAHECEVSRVLADGTFVPVVDITPIAEACELEGLAIDQRGNFYIANGAVHRVFKADAGGTSIVLAGTGTGGFSGDGGPAIAATLMRPVGIAVDASGNVYIADSYNNRVRIVNKKGIITTVAGTGDFGFNGDVVAAPQARFAEPRGLAFGDNKLFVVDQSNRRVRQLQAGGNGKK